MGRAPVVAPAPSFALELQTGYPFGGAVSVDSAGSPRRSSRERSASALTHETDESGRDLAELIEAQPETQIVRTLICREAARD
jgi:hypothetical protein